MGPGLRSRCAHGLGGFVLFSFSAVFLPLRTLKSLQGIGILCPLGCRSEGMSFFSASDRRFLLFFFFFFQIAKLEKVFEL